MSTNSEELARRVEEGAANLAAFARDLTDAEWNTPMSPTDNRTIGQIVNHVALMYPVEVDLARSIAEGKAVNGVTWEVVAGINAEHVHEHPLDDRMSVLDRLRRNGREAAEAVRSFSDVDLGRSSALGLASGAPVTAQFVIEDHAVRHSWYHLGRIRERLGR